MSVCVCVLVDGPFTAVSTSGSVIVTGCENGMLFTWPLLNLAQIDKRYFRVNK